MPVRKNILRLILKWATGAKLAIIAGLLAFGQAHAGEERSYIFAIVPQQSATVLAASWAPVIKGSSTFQVDLRISGSGAAIR